MDDENADYLDVAKNLLDGPEFALQALAAATVAQAEELRKLNRMLDSQAGPPYASITVDGHVTTGMP